MDGVDRLLYQYLTVLDRILQEGGFYIPLGNVLVVAQDVMETGSLWNRLPAEMPDPESNDEAPIPTARFLRRLTELTQDCPPTQLDLVSCTQEGNDYPMFFCC